MPLYLQLFITSFPLLPKLEISWTGKMRGYTTRRGGREDRCKSSGNIQEVMIYIIHGVYQLVILYVFLWYSFAMTSLGIGLASDVQLGTQIFRAIGIGSLTRVPYSC